MSFLRFTDTMALVWKEQLEKAGVFLQRLLLFCFLPASFSLGFATVLWLLHTTHCLHVTGCCVSWGKCVRLSFLFPSPLSHCVPPDPSWPCSFPFVPSPKLYLGWLSTENRLWTLENEVLALSLSCSVDLSGQLHFLGFKTVKYEETNVHFLGML